MPHAEKIKYRKKEKGKKRLGVTNMIVSGYSDI
jgi:hypothetical protein